MNKPTQQQTNKAKQLINKNDPTKLNRKKKNQQCNERAKIWKITSQKDSDTTGTLKSKKNRHVICFQKGTSQKTQKDQ